MDNTQILHQAIEKATKNGFDVSENFYLDGYFDEWYRTEGNHNREYQIIFSHDFAKAFWGERPLWVCNCGYVGTHRTDKDGWPANDHQPCDPEGSYGTTQIAFKFYLQQMVLEPDPISYLAKFL